MACPQLQSKVDEVDNKGDIPLDQALQTVQEIVAESFQCLTHLLTDNSVSNSLTHGLPTAAEQGERSGQQRRHTAGPGTADCAEGNS